VSEVTPTGKALPAIIMLTTDMALLEDPEYLNSVKLFAADQDALDLAFSSGEYKQLCISLYTHQLMVIW
jgi:catalase (peroxidase I)